MSFTPTDARALLEVLLACGTPVGLIVAGVLLRRRSPSSRARRTLGAVLLGTGVLWAAGFVVFILNYLGKI